MATVITRTTWTNDTGTPASPVGDGTVINNARLQGDVYDKVDQMFAGGAGYETFTFGGAVATEGFDASGFAAIFSASRTGGIVAQVKNPTAGTANNSEWQLGNDGSNLGRIIFCSSTFTTAGSVIADGLSMLCNGAGGLIIAATHASGAIKFHTGGSNKRWEILAAGQPVWSEVSADPSASDLTSGANAKDRMAIYMKSDKVVIAYNHSGTVWYLSCGLDASGGTWTQSSTAP